ncbi:MAG: Rrf2 family transcriptional regulator, partial [Calditrichia bacterium]|nr:Rrf2 family transcriptional regulator [Calditrichia bacterium]
MFSKSCKYGLRATIYLNHYKNEGFISINQIAEKLNIPFHFLTKVMQKLNNAGIVESRRGPVGGVKLVKREKNISLYD